ncbi:hypothetical protein [Nocardia sp. NPDC047648]|uniref:hypothetical protein n=1 Tax=Nocardia sp. NPDC047648 TaxID=3155625 RepID=UPI0033D6E741
MRREAEVVSATEENARSGALVVVDVAIRLFTAAGELAVEEQQNLIYREAAPRPDKPAALPDSPEPGTPLTRISGAEWAPRTDPDLLVRFSAATANAHRIRYDWPYATGVEGYPALVVHGPLQALALAEVHRLMAKEAGPNATVGIVTTGLSVRTPVRPASRARRRPAMRRGRGSTVGRYAGC